MTFSAARASLPFSRADSRTPATCWLTPNSGSPGIVTCPRTASRRPGTPEFGVSQHVAGVLLSARENGSDARAALNVTYSEALRDALAAQGHTPTEFDADREIEDAIADALAAEPDADVLYQTGGFGIEPALYILGLDAPAVATALRECAG